MAHNKDFNFNLDLSGTHESPVDKQLLLDHARNQIEKVANTYHKDFPEYMQAKILTVYPTNLFDLASLDETKIWYNVPSIIPGASQYLQPQQVVQCRFYSVDSSRPYIRNGMGMSGPAIDLSPVIPPISTTFLLDKSDIADLFTLPSTGTTYQFSCFHGFLSGAPRRMDLGGLTKNLTLSGSEVLYYPDPTTFPRNGDYFKDTVTRVEMNSSGEVISIYTATVYQGGGPHFDFSYFDTITGAMVEATGTMVNPNWIEGFAQIRLASRYSGGPLLTDSFDILLIQSGSRPFLTLSLYVAHAGVVSVGDTFNLANLNYRASQPGDLTFRTPATGVFHGLNLNNVTAGHVNITSIIYLPDSRQRIVGYEGLLYTPASSSYGLNGPFTFAGVTWFAP